MNTPLLRTHERGITHTQALFAFATFIILAVVVMIAMPMFTRCFQHPHGMANQLSNGRQIYLSMRNYASEMGHEGAFPAYADTENRTGLAMNSNQAFEILLPRYMDDKRPFFNKYSAWCITTVKSQVTLNINRVQSGESDWCYVRGLRDDSNSHWPLIANAFAPGTTTYVKDQSKPGGVWKGANAIVVYVGGSAAIVETKEIAQDYFVGRSDKPNLDAFQKDADWLVGDEVQLLYPMAN
jgi:hypothetical protein